MAKNGFYVDLHAAELIQGIDQMQALIEQFRERFDHQLQPEGFSGYAP